MIKPLGRDEARNLIAESRTGRLGVVSDGGPYVVPVNYVFDGEYLYVHSLPGRKLEALRANPLSVFVIWNGLSSLGGLVGLILGGFA